jgi:hypothetical protein
MPLRDVFHRGGFAWGSKDKICVARDGFLTIGKYSHHTKRRTASMEALEDIRLADWNARLADWKGDPVSGAISAFGAVVELDKCIVVVGSDRDVLTINGEPVNWRVFNKSRCYENQLHIIYEDRLELYSFNHDYFLDQNSKLTGTQHTRPFRFAF